MSSSQKGMVYVRMEVLPAPPLTRARVSSPTNPVVCMTPRTAVRRMAFGRTGRRSSGMTAKSAIAPKKVRIAAKVKGCA